MIIHATILLVKPWNYSYLSELTPFQKCPGTVQRCCLGTIPKELECGDPILEGRSLTVWTQSMQPLNSNEWSMVYFIHSHRCSL